MVRYVPLGPVVRYVPLGPVVRYVPLGPDVKHGAESLVGRRVDTAEQPPGVVTGRVGGHGFSVRDPPYLAAQCGHLAREVRDVGPLRVTQTRVRVRGLGAAADSQRRDITRR